LIRTSTRKGSGGSSIREPATGQGHLKSNAWSAGSPNPRATAIRVVADAAQAETPSRYSTSNSRVRIPARNAFQAVAL
jgi:hypothetical protein